MRVLLLPFTHLEDWSLRILVDGNNDFAVLHPSQMLDGSRDANSNIQLRCDDLPSLTDLSL